MKSGDKSLDAVYYDRNVSAFALLRALDIEGYDVYWRHTDDPEWPVICAQLGYGEVGWHVPMEELEPHKDWIRQAVDDYEYYSREVKNDRLLEFAQSGPASAADIADNL